MVNQGSISSLTLPRGYRVPPELSSRSAGNRLGGQKYTGPYLLLSKLPTPPGTPLCYPNPMEHRSGLSPVAQTRPAAEPASPLQQRDGQGCRPSLAPPQAEGPWCSTKASAPTNPAEEPGLMATYTLGDLLLSLLAEPRPSLQSIARGDTIARLAHPSLDGHVCITITSTPQARQPGGKERSAPRRPRHGGQLRCPMGLGGEGNQEGFLTITSTERITMFDDSCISAAEQELRDMKFLEGRFDNADIEPEELEPPEGN